MKQVLIFSDAHISLHKGSLDRMQDCLNALEWVFTTAKQKNIDTVIFVGDLFQDRQKIQVIAYQKTFEILEKHKDINLYLLIGNHDMWNSESREISSIFPLRALPKVKIIDQPCCLNIKGVNVDFLPYTKNPKECVENNFKEKSDVLFGHLAIDGAYLNTFYNTVSEVSVEYEGDMVKVDVGVFNGWKKVLLGHYHGAQKVNEIVEYIGSPLQLNFNEVFQKKHIIAMDLDNLFCEYIENTFSPRHLIVKESEIGNYKLKGNFVRIESDNLSSSKIIDIKNSLSGVVSTLEFKEIKSNKHNELKTDLDKAKKILSEGEIVEKYISLVETSLEKEKLMLIGRQIIQKGTSS